MAERGRQGRFRFSLKEGLVTVAGTALALGSLKSDDPWVIVPMLVLSGSAFVVICIWHEGRPASRVVAAVVLVGLLTFNGWRDLRESTSTRSVATPPLNPVNPPSSPKTTAQVDQKQPAKPIKSPHPAADHTTPKKESGGDTPATPQQIISAPNGIAIGGGTVTNPTVNNFVPPARHISEDQKSKIVAAIKGKPVRVSFTSLVTIADAQQFAFEICEAFRDGGATTNCESIPLMAEEEAGHPWVGIKFSYKGNVQGPDGYKVRVPYDTPAGIVISALSAAGIGQCVVHPDPKMDEGEVMVTVGQPPATP